MGLTNQHDEMPLREAISEWLGRQKPSTQSDVRKAVGRTNYYNLLNPKGPKGPGLTVIDRIAESVGSSRREFVEALYARDGIAPQFVDQAVDRRTRLYRRFNQVLVGERAGRVIAICESLDEWKALDEAIALAGKLARQLGR